MLDVDTDTDTALRWARLPIHTDLPARTTAELISAGPREVTGFNGQDRV